MEDEVIYFDEEVKGHKLLITSREVIFKGSQFQTSLIDAVSTVTHQSSTNGVPTAAVYMISMTCKTETIKAYFLLETFPNKSTKVDKFVKSFFESTIDGYLSNETHPVSTEKIRSAMVRVLKGTHDDEVRKMTDTIYRTFCGYVHANYAHIMEIYNGHTYDFNIKGVPSIEERQKRMELVDLAAKGVLHAAAFIAHTLDLTDLHHDIVQSWQQQSEGYPLSRRKP